MTSDRRHLEPRITFDSKRREFLFRRIAEPLGKLISQAFSLRADGSFMRRNIVIYKN